MNILVFMLILSIASTHLLVSRLHFQSETKAYRFLSFTSGVAVAYVFLHLFPDIADARDKYSTAGGAQGIIAEQLFLVSLVGLIVYYGIDRVSDMIGTSLDQQSPRSGTINILIHAAGYGFYNFMIGYLVVNLPRPGIVPVLLICIVLALHFLGLGHHFRHTHQELYDRWLRWLFVACLLSGWAAGEVLGLSTFFKAVAFAFLAGAMIINTIKEELPDSKQARYAPFLAGVALFFAVMLVLDEYFPRVY